MWSLLYTSSCQKMHFYLGSLHTLIPLDSSRGSTAQTNGKILLFSTVLLYLSTTTYMAALVWSWSIRSSSISKAFAGLYSPSYNGVDVNIVLHAMNQQSWMLTIAFGLNVSIAVLR